MSTASSRDDDRDSSSTACLDRASVEYQHRFGLPSSELLHETFSCALQKGILRQGKLFISQHFLCFFSNILTSEARLCIRADRIEYAEEASVLLFPTAIRITHDHGESTLLASFLARDRALDLIRRISKGQRIGRQRVQSARELDRAAAESEAEETRARLAAASLDHAPKHRQLLEKRTATNNDAATTKRAERKSSSGGATSRVEEKERDRGRERRVEDEEEAEDVLAAFKKPKSDRSRPSSDGTTSRVASHGRASLGDGRGGGSSEEEVDTSAAPTSALQRLTNLITAIPVPPHPPRLSQRAVSTQHGVVLIDENPRAVLTQGRRFKHVRVGSALPPDIDGADGPIAALSPGLETTAQHVRSPSTTAPLTYGYAAPTSSPSFRPRPSGGPLPPPPRSLDGSAADESDEDDASRPTLSRPSSTTARSVALPMKPRSTRAQRPRRRREESSDSDEEA